MKTASTLSPHARCSWRILILALLVVAWSSLATVAQAQKQWDSRRVVGARPLIDGYVSPGEWDAYLEFNEFVLLRTSGKRDTSGSRMRTTWDDRGVYLLLQSDYTGWSAPSELGMHFGEDNWNVYFNPNTQNGPNNDSNPSHYQLGWNTRRGFGSVVGGVQKNTGTFAEAGANVAFGNNAGWPYDRDKFPVNSRIATNHSEFGGFSEFFMDWRDFNADDPRKRLFNPPSGLYHPMAPDVDDQWHFQIGRISSDASKNYLPAFQLSSNNFSFVTKPTGLLNFTDYYRGDMNNDNRVDNEDISGFLLARSDLSAYEALTGITNGARRGDVNLDGQFDSADSAPFALALLRGPGQAVPEPGALVLAANGLAGFAGYFALKSCRRRRR